MLRVALWWERGQSRIVQAARGSEWLPVCFQGAGAAGAMSGEMESLCGFFSTANKWHTSCSADQEWRAGNAIFVRLLSHCR